MKKLVSIIVPIYNVEQYLDRCIESLVTQSYINLEIILIDDGSKDTSGDICDLWAQRDKRIRLVHKENGGLSDARNKGLDIATGDIISFIDSLKEEYSINRVNLLKNSLLENLKVTIGMWFIGSTVIGMPIVLGIVLYRGFCIGYTISSVILVLRYTKGNYLFTIYYITSKYYFCSSFNCISS